MIFCFLTWHLMASAVDADVTATAAPLLHIPGEDSSRTVLVCVISNLRDSEVEVIWLSGRTGESSQTGHTLGREEDGSCTATSIISVASHEWENFTCFVSYRGPGNRWSRQYIHVASETADPVCLEDSSFVPDVIRMQTDVVVISALRILLVKITIFNLLITAQAVMKSASMNEERAPPAGLNVVLVRSFICTIHYSAGT